MSILNRRWLTVVLTMVWWGASPAATTGPRHVMSLSMCTDALLLDLLPPDRIASITFLSRQPSNLIVWPQAAFVPINHGSVEEVLAEKPDLIVAGTFTTPTARVLIRRAGIALIEVPPANDFAAIRATTRSVAHALGKEAAAESLIGKMDATLRALEATKPQRVIRVAGWSGGGSVPGRGSLFDAILGAAGGVNIAASGERDGSFDIEQLLFARPDIIAYGGDDMSTPSLHTDNAAHPLLLKVYAGRRISYPSSLYSCGVVESADAAVALRSSILTVMLERTHDPS